MYIPKSSKNKSITIALCGNQVGGIFAPLVGVIVFASLGWRLYFRTDYFIKIRVQELTPLQDIEIDWLKKVILKGKTK